MKSPARKATRQQAWNAEILKRIREIRSGAVKPVSWSEALRAIFDRAR